MHTQNPEERLANHAPFERETFRARFWTDPRATLRPSPVAGCGLFAIAPFRAGETVEIMGGTPMTEAEFRAFQAASDRTGHAYNAVQVGDDLHLVEQSEITATRRGSINHSCDSNLWMGDAVTIIARRDIAEGEELTLDYALCSAQPDLSLDQFCACKSPLCRGTVTGRDWQIPALQARYAGHFSPFLNARIARQNDG